jgi:hypothetical protein
MRKTPYFRVRAAPHLPIAVALTACLWLGFTAHRDGNRPLCRIDTDNCRSTTATKIVRHDPYCVVDPTCIAPNFDIAKANLPSTGVAVQWQGFAVLNDSSFVYGNPMRMLAVPNLCFFVLSFLGGLWLARVVPAPWGTMATAALATWYCLEAARWFEAVWRLAGSSSDGTFLIEPITYLGLAVTLGPLLFGLYCTRSSHRLRH